MALPVRDRRVSDVATWGPGAEFEQMTRRLAGLFDEVWGSGSGWHSNGLWNTDHFRPAADLEETDDAYVVEVELPGVDKGDVDIELVGRRLAVSGERKERQRTGILRRRTRTAGRFFYEVVLPGDTDENGVSARLADGVLTITVPKAAAERQARRIPIT